MSNTDCLLKNLKSSLPPGALWTPKGDSETLFISMAESFEEIYETILNVSKIRFPDDSVRYLDLADEFGVDFFGASTEDDIRLLIRQAQKGVKCPGAGDLQKALNDAGFDVQVHRNGPTSINPASFLGGNIPFACDGNEKSVDGNEMAIDGVLGGGDILVNGSIIATRPLYRACDGNEVMCDGNKYALDGYFESVQDFEYQNVLGNEPDYWNNVYFIGGDVTRNPTTGAIISILQADVPSDMRNEFESLILKYGPGEGWAGMLINYT